MERQIKSYVALIPRVNFWGMLLVLPAILIALNAVYVSLFGFGSVQFCFLIYCFLDIFCDFWVFGGICSKNGNKMEYVKSSFYGDEVLRKSIIGDEVRRFLGLTVTAIGLMVAYCMTLGGRLTAAQWLYIGHMVFVPLFLNTAALNLTRYFNLLWLHNLAACFVGSLDTGFLAGIVVLGFEADLRRHGYTLAVLVVLSVITAVLTVWHTMHRVKQSYYDTQGSKSK
jgi:hypothetical protein